jgi:hypothetical protein
MSPFDASVFKIKIVHSKGCPIHEGQPFYLNQVTLSRAKTYPTGYPRIIKSFEGGLGETLQKFQPSRRRQQPLGESPKASKNKVAQEV